MRVIIKEEENQGLESLLGKNIWLWCGNYIYTGTLVGVNDKCVKLEKPSVVYETGPLDAKKFQNAQRLPSETGLVMTQWIEYAGEV